MRLYCGIILALSICLALASKRYDGYKVFSLKVDNKEQLQKIIRLAESDNGFDFWSHPQIGGDTDVMVPPRLLDCFKKVANYLMVQFKIKVNDVQKLIDSQEQVSRSSSNTFNWYDYYTLDVIYDWLDEQVDRHDELTQQVIGKTYEGREMRGVKLSKKSGNPAIIIEANIHAREWITSATATYLLNALLTSKSPEIQDLANNIDWYIIPVANPDGYAYTQNDRLWRKSRSRTNDPSCIGVDLNRNFGYKWQPAGSPCSEFNAGPYGFSEIETRNIQNYLKNSVKNKDRLYLSFHSYGQYILLPWGHTTTRIYNYKQLMEIGNAAKAGFGKLFGTYYRVGNVPEILYIATGSSVDWAVGEIEIPIAMAIEFRDRGVNAFILPPEDIIPNGEETLDAIINLVAKSRDLGYLNNE